MTPPHQDYIEAITKVMWNGGWRKNFWYIAAYLTWTTVADIAGHVYYRHSNQTWTYKGLEIKCEIYNSMCEQWILFYWCYIVLCLLKIVFCLVEYFIYMEMSQRWTNALMRALKWTQIPTCNYNFVLKNSNKAHLVGWVRGECIRSTFTESDSIFARLCFYKILLPSTQRWPKQYFCKMYINVVLLCYGLIAFTVVMLIQTAQNNQCPLLLTWFNFNPSMDK